MAKPPEHPVLPSDWQIVGTKLLVEGIGGQVWLAECADGTQTIVKVASHAALGDAASAADYLRWRDGHGAIWLLTSDGETHLLEYAGEERLLDYQTKHGDDAAMDIAAEVIGRLHTPSPYPTPKSLTPLRDHFSSLFTRAEADRRSGKATHLIEIAEIADRLLDNQRDIQPLHGDIHHENILRGPRGWLAIDPKGVVGDPAYDVANLFHNPVHYLERESEARILRLATKMTDAVHRDVETVLAFAVAYSGLSECWWLEVRHQQAATSTRAIGQKIRAALAQIRF